MTTNKTAPITQGCPSPEMTAQLRSIARAIEIDNPGVSLKSLPSQKMMDELAKINITTRREL